MNKGKDKSMNTKNILLTLFLIAGLFMITAPATQAQTCEGKGPNFVDLNGDGFNDNAPDHDGDGIPNGLDPDYIKMAQDGSGYMHQKGEMNKYAYKGKDDSQKMNKFQKGNRFQTANSYKFQYRYNQASGTNGQGAGNCGGIGPQGGSGIIDGNGHHGPMGRGI